MSNTIIGTCIDYTHDGKGVVKIDKMPIFVDNLIIGEEAEILITKKEKKFGYGRVLKLIKVSENRVKPRCENYKYCGGCHLQHMTYEEQLRFKAKRVKDVIHHIAGLDVDLPIIHGMDNPLRYRNKVQVPFGVAFNGQVIAGFYKNKSHQIIDMNECFIEDKDADNLINVIKRLCEKYEIEPADINNNIGLLRYVIVRKSHTNNDLLVVLVCQGEYIPNCKAFINELVEKQPHIKTVVMNINYSKSSVVLGDKEKILYGKGYIVDNICGLNFNISAHSFYQINPVQTEILYNKAIEFANLNKNEKVLDAYCGVGTIGLIASSKCGQVTGVELVRSAVKDAIENAKNNNIKNSYFICDDATKFIMKEAKSHNIYDCMFFDPPRDGCSKEFINSVLKMKPRKIVYVSCDPSSLARDLVSLKQLYKLERIECVDMFPQTYHVETVVRLTLKG